MHVLPLIPLCIFIFIFVVVCHFPFLEFVLKILLMLIMIAVVIVQEDWASCIWPSYWNGLQKEIGNKHSSINLLFILLRFTNFLTILILDFIKIYKIGNNKHSSSYQISCFLILDYTCLDLLYKYLVALYSADNILGNFLFNFFLNAKITVNEGRIEEINFNKTKITSNYFNTFKFNNNHIRHFIIKIIL